MKSLKEKFMRPLFEMTTHDCFIDHSSESMNGHAVYKRICRFGRMISYFIFIFIFQKIFQKMFIFIFHIYFYIFIFHISLII